MLGLAATIESIKGASMGISKGRSRGDSGPTTSVSIIDAEDEDDDDDDDDDEDDDDDDNDEEGKVIDDAENLIFSGSVDV